MCIGSPVLTFSHLYPTWTLLRGHKYALQLIHVVKFRVNSGTGVQADSPKTTQHLVSPSCPSKDSVGGWGAGTHTLYTPKAWFNCVLFYFPVAPAPLFCFCHIFVDMDLPWTHLPVIINKCSCFSLAVWLWACNSLPVVHKNPESISWINHVVTVPGAGPSGDDGVPKVGSQRWSPQEWDESPYERDFRELLHFFHTLWGNSEKSADCSQKQVLTRAWPCWHPDSELPDSRTVRNTFLLCLSYPVCTVVCYSSPKGQRKMYRLLFALAIEVLKERSDFGRQKWKCLLSNAG